jgi:hypothetical protein
VASPKRESQRGAGELPHLLLQLVQGRWDRGVLGHPVGGRAEAVHPVPEGHGAEPLVGLVDLGDHRHQRLRRHGHLHLAQQPLDPGGLAGEADPEQLAHRAAAAVAADEVARAQPRAVGQLGGHPLVVLAQPHQFAAAPDLDAEFGGVLGQQALDGGLRDAEDVRMCGVQPVRRRLADAGEETAERVLLAEREEPLQQTALVHHLDAAHVQAQRTGKPGRLRLLLQHDHLHAVQPQLAGQHQAGRPAAGNDHVNHETPIAIRPAAVLPSTGDCAARPGSCRKPPGALYINSGKECVTSLPFPLPSAVDGQPPCEAAARRVRRFVGPGGSPLHRTPP